MNKIFLGVFLIFCAGCAAPKAYVQSRLPGTLTLNELAQAHKIQWQWDTLTHVVTLNYSGRKMYVMEGSALVLDGENLVSLRAAVQKHNGVIVIPDDFVAKIIERVPESIENQPPTVVEPKAVPSHLKTVVLDAGHGGKDPGAIGPSGIYEKTVVLDIAQRVKPLLEAAGWTVIMTRGSDEFISLAGRTEKASSVNADLFVSIHANSSRARSGSGMEIFYAKPQDPQARNEQQRRENYQRLARSLAGRQDVPAVHEIVEDLLYTAKQSNSSSFAQTVIKNASSEARTKSRGVKEANFYVLRNTLIPAVLVEVGFLTNPGEEKQLNTPNYRQKLAESMAKAIIEYEVY